MDIPSYVLGKKAGGGGQPINLQEKEVEITENGEQTITADSGYDGLSKVDITTNVSGGDTPEVEEKDVNFYDYDGKRVYSYTAQEFLALDSMPENPTHEGLTAQGWNWTKSEARTYVTNNGILDLGQNYVTSDGYTRIYVTIPYGGHKPYLGLNINGSVDVDWGDGSAEETITGTSESTTVYTQHTFPKSGGNYVITIKPQNDILLGLAGAQYRGSNILCASDTNQDYSGIYRSCITKIELGSSVNLRSYCLMNLNNLKSISVPTNIKMGTIYLNATECDFIMPNSSTIMPSGSYWFFGCGKVIMSRNVRSYSNQWYQDCNQSRFILSNFNSYYSSNFSMNKCSVLTVPSNYTDLLLDNTYLYGLACLDCSHCTRIPSLGSYTKITSNCKIVVPDDLYEDWIVATNWSTYASQIIKKSDWEAQQ